MERTMKFFTKFENQKNTFQFFTHQKYEIPLKDIMLVKKHLTESVFYALYMEDGIVYLLTNVSILNNCLMGYGNYSKPYCKIEDINDYKLNTLDKDAYNWYMTQAR